MSLIAVAAAGQPGFAQVSAKTQAPGDAKASSGVPRTADGHPDLSGVYTANFTNNGRRVVDLDLGIGVEIPFQPWSKEKFEENKSGRGRYADPETNCMPAGVPRRAFRIRCGSFRRPGCWRSFTKATSTHTA